MCYTHCFLYFFTIRAGSACVSSMLLALGVIGSLLVPVLPFSRNATQFFLIMGYMLLLVIAFTTALCGSLTESRISVCIGLSLGIMAFIFWLGLTVPTLLDFRSTSINNFCLGLNCGESHWMVPRQWNSKDFTDSVARKTYSTARKGVVPDVLLDNAADARSRLMQYEDVPLERSLKKFWKAKHYSIDKIAERQTSTIRIHANLSEEDEDWEDVDESLTWAGNQSIPHSLSKRQIPGIRGRTSRFPSPQFVSVGNSMRALNKGTSIILTVLYGLLYVCALATIGMNLASFACPERECSCCEQGMVRWVPA